MSLGVMRARVAKPPRGWLEAIDPPGGALAGLDWHPAGTGRLESGACSPDGLRATS